MLFPEYLSNKMGVPDVTGGHTFVCPYLLSVKLFIQRAKSLDRISCNLDRTTNEPHSGSGGSKRRVTSGHVLLSSRKQKSGTKGNTASLYVLRLAGLQSTM